jgi:DNA-binding CsgD family transcriptional regulator
MICQAMGRHRARSEGLADRESEILALITHGKSNAEVATLTYCSPNTVKSYIRTIYRKIEVTSRTQAVLWASATASHPTTTASNTGAEDPDHTGCDGSPPRWLRF